MRVVVVGATGNVGTSLLEVLRDDEDVESIVGIARRLPAHVPAKVEWVRADVTRDALAPHFAGADCVVHLAWLIQPSRDRNATWLANVHGSTRVFEAVAEAGVPSLVYASSVGAYSPGPKDRLVDESWPTGGVRTSFYSRDKAEVERRLDRFEAEHAGIRVVRLRPSLIFKREMGTEVKRLFTGRLVPHPLISKRTIPFVPDTPRLRFQVTHTRDVAQAYRLAVRGDARGAFNVAADPVLDPDELARLLDARKVRVPERVLRGLVAATWRARLQPTPEGWVDMALETPLLDSTRARTELGWEPARSAGDALLDLLAGFNDGAGAPTPPLRP
jgi:nucleoside-diphosphate-sugar epimerase